MDITDTSFEEIESSFINEPNPYKNYRNGNNNSDNSTRRATIPSKSKVLHSMLPAPLSTASSGGTAFSEEVKEQSTWVKEDENCAFNENMNEFEDIENDEEFLDDFQEFQNKKDDFDEAIKTHFRAFPMRQTSIDEMYSLGKQFNNNLDFNTHNLDSDGHKITSTLRQPKSMMNLKTKRMNNNEEPLNKIRSGRLKSSISFGNLHHPSRNPNSVRFKRSMPKLSPGIVEEDDDDEFENGNTSVVRQRLSSDYYLNKFGEDVNNSEDNDFIFESSMIQPQFVPKLSRSNIPFKLSPSVYDIEQHTDLLTPQLHRRSKKNWNHRDQLENFRETSSTNNSRKASGRVTLNQVAPTYRMRTIKQQIDHNTPVKNGKMYYNPQSMKWEGNEGLLQKFDELDSNSTNPLLIKKNQQHNKLENVKLRNRSQKSPEVVGDMMFDEKNLRWVSIHEEPPDPFAGIDDIVQPEEDLHFKSPFIRSKSQMNPNPIARALSENPNLRKYYSVGGVSRDNKFGLNGSDIENELTNSTFSISSKLLEYFYHEDNRWNKKVGGWFILNNSNNNNTNDNTQSFNNVSVTSHDSKDYMYEIRKMVLNSTRN